MHCGTENLHFGVVSVFGFRLDYKRRYIYNQLINNCSISKLDDSAIKLNISNVRRKFNLAFGPPTVLKLSLKSYICTLPILVRFCLNSVPPTFLRLNSGELKFENNLGFFAALQAASHTNKIIFT